MHHVPVRLSSAFVAHNVSRRRTLLHGSMDSSFARILAPGTSSTERPSCRSGVLPISSVMEEAIFGFVRTPTMSPISAAITGWTAGRLALWPIASGCWAVKDRAAVESANIVLEKRGRFAFAKKEVVGAL